MAMSLLRTLVRNRPIGPVTASRRCHPQGRARGLPSTPKPAPEWDGVQALNPGPFKAADSRRFRIRDRRRQGKLSLMWSSTAAFSSERRHRDTRLIRSYSRFAGFARCPVDPDARLRPQRRRHDVAGGRRSFAHRSCTCQRSTCQRRQRRLAGHWPRSGIDSRRSDKPECHFVPTNHTSRVITPFAQQVGAISHHQRAHSAIRISFRCHPGYHTRFQKPGFDKPPPSAKVTHISGYFRNDFHILGSRHDPADPSIKAHSSCCSANRAHRDASPKPVQMRFPIGGKLSALSPGSADP